MSEKAVSQCDVRPTPAYPDIVWTPAVAGAVRAKHKGCEIFILPHRNSFGVRIMLVKVTCTSWECINMIEINGDEAGVLSIAKDMAASFAERVGER